jgi:hypothetical protein
MSSNLAALESADTMRGKIRLLLGRCLAAASIRADVSRCVDYPRVQIIGIANMYLTSMAPTEPVPPFILAGSRQSSTTFWGLLPTRTPGEILLSCRS